ncbi:MAG: hypothetical protein JSS33_12860, partial [Proteobacteria bacterium]|nr:hypothetical protein [Pseudomonadota bacterium]
AELYDPATNLWSAAGTLANARAHHTATLLSSGKVLVAGGSGSSGPLNSAELYNPATNTWSSAGTLLAARESHTATLLHWGQVLVAGGNGSGGSLTSVEVYDPDTNAWFSTGSLAVGRSYHTATLLPSGKVLVAGGYGSTTFLNSAELYDPAAYTWSVAGAFTTAREYHTATLLPSGKVLLVGGSNTFSDQLDSVELYDPIANSWGTIAALGTGRHWHTATLLPSGRVLVAGGSTASKYLAGIEQFDPGTAVRPSILPSLGNLDPFVLPTSPLTANSSASSYTGSGALVATGLRPMASASSGASNDSASNLPVFQIQSIDSQQQRFIPNDPSVDFTDTSFASSANALSGFPFGPILVRVWVNGVPSAARLATLESDEIFKNGFDP